MAKRSKDERVRKFLADTGDASVERLKILDKMRGIVFARFPKVGERIMYGGIMFSVDGEDFGGLFVYKNHISFEFSFGAFMKDEGKILEGGGKLRRHLKILDIGDVEKKKVKFFVGQVGKNKIKK